MPLCHCVNPHPPHTEISTNKQIIQFMESDSLLKKVLAGVFTFSLKIYFCIFKCFQAWCLRQKMKGILANNRRGKEELFLIITVMLRFLTINSLTTSRPDLDPVSKTYLWQFSIWKERGKLSFYAILALVLDGAEELKEILSFSDWNVKCCFSTLYLFLSLARLISYKFLCTLLALIMWTIKKNEMEAEAAKQHFEQCN